METVKLSSEAHILIPNWLCDAYHWEAGFEFVVIDTGDSALIKPIRPFASMTLEEVAGSLSVSKTMKTVEEMEDDLRRGVWKAWDAHG